MVPSPPPTAPIAAPNVATEYTLVGGKNDSLGFSLRELWQYRALVREMVRRELNIRYKNRVGGILWSLFPPLLQVFTLTVMVKLFLGNIGNYSAYLMAVLFLYQYVQNTILDCGNCILHNTSLVKKVYFPRAILPLVALITNTLHFAVSLGLILVYFFLMPVSHPIYPQNLGWKFFLIFPALLGTGMFSLGIGFLIARLNTLYEDVRFLSLTFFSLFFYMLPILYPIERVAARPDIYPFYMLNPVATFLVTFQRALLPPLELNEARVTYPVEIPYAFFGIALAVSFLTLLVGFYSFERSKWLMVERM